MPLTMEEEDVEVPMWLGLVSQSQFGMETITATGTRPTTSESTVGGRGWLPLQQGSLGTAGEDPSHWSLGHGTPLNSDGGMYANVTERKIRRVGRGSILGAPDLWRPDLEDSTLAGIGAQAGAREEYPEGGFEVSLWMGTTRNWQHNWRICTGCLVASSG